MHTCMAPWGAYCLVLLNPFHVPSRNLPMPMQDVRKEGDDAKGSSLSNLPPEERARLWHLQSPWAAGDPNPRCAAHPSPAPPLQRAPWPAHVGAT